MVGNRTPCTKEGHCLEQGQAPRDQVRCSLVTICTTGHKATTLRRRHAPTTRCDSLRASSPRRTGTNESTSLIGIQESIYRARLQLAL